MWRVNMAGRRLSGHINTEEQPTQYELAVPDLPGYRCIVFWGWTAREKFYTTEKLLTWVEDPR